MEGRATDVAQAFPLVEKCRPESPRDEYGARSALPGAATFSLRI